MFDRQGEITPPCGEPSVAWRRSPSSSTPAFSHLSIILRMTPSVTRLSRNERRWECEIESKYFSMSKSITQRSPWLRSQYATLARLDEQSDPAGSRTSREENPAHK